MTLQAPVLSYEQRKQYYQSIPLNARQLEKLQENKPRREQARDEHLQKRDKEQSDAR